MTTILKPIGGPCWAYALPQWPDLVTQGDTHETTFRARNIGDAQLTFTVSADGSLAQWIQGAMLGQEVVVGPGRSATIELTMVVPTNAQPGVREGTIQVASNAVSQPIVSIPVAVNFTQHDPVDLVVQPPSWEAEALPGDMLTQRFTIRRADGGPISLVVRHVPNWASVGCEAGSDTVILVVDAKLPAGKRRVSDKIVLGEHRPFVNQAKIPVCLRKRKVPTCDPSPTSLTLPPLFPGMSSHAVVRITNNGDADLQFNAEMAVPCEWLDSIAVEPGAGLVKPGESTRLRITAKAPRDGSLHSAVGNVRISWSDNKEWRDIPCGIHVRWLLKPADPRRRIWAWTIDLGQLGVTALLVVVTLHLSLGEYGFHLIRRYLYGLLLLHPVLTIWFSAVYGCTPGKRMMGIEVRRVSDARRPGLAVSVRRYAAYLICLLPPAVTSIFIDGASRGWHDRLAGTIVMSTERTKTSDEADMQGLQNVNG